MSEHRLDKIVIERPRSGMRISSNKSIRKSIKQQLQQLKYDYQEDEIGSLKREQVSFDRTRELESLERVSGNMKWKLIDGKIDGFPERGTLSTAFRSYSCSTL
ncbi:hypothetical protein H1P_2370017 [Hyella patelloides LEGE 07179]|uniref:Uncharacterized protein n=1 Tax=Hyella patelloides LEGE 07179 TaxID=945734 RepID=A0A563VRJ3_9CYAN|nr:hypothetical protein [Hyella patelloides]VEP14078.1 hypothetical protein H1P_2370017 [Hyella patelloides LEGE 07179]